jgi:hypothetical protein
MGKVLEAIDNTLARFIAAQPLFFVATAPLAGDGHVNLSPKGLDSFRVLAPDRVAYLDLTGSGNETAAHLAENGRITVMFCAFAGAPRILRLYGRGRAVVPGDAEWAESYAHFEEMPGARQVIVIDVERVQTSCGFGVPLMEPARDRDALVRWAEAKGPDGIRQYQQTKNATSIDGLPARLPGG